MPPIQGRTGAAVCRLGLALALLMTASPARAQSDQEKAGVLVEKGLDKARDGKFAEAMPLFDQAFKLFPHPEILHNLARAHEELGQLPLALDEFRRALEMDKDYTFASDAQKRVVDIPKRLRVTHGLVRVTSTPAQVELTFSVDGKPFEGHLVAPAERWVPAGRLRISGTRPGYIDGAEEIDVVAGSEPSVEIVLPPIAQKGFIAVVTTVEGGTVRIDGEAVGTTPLATTPIAAGVHTVRVEADGHEPFEERIVVEPDRETVVRATLLRPGEMIEGGGSAGAAGPKPGLGAALVGGGLAVAVVGAVLHGLAFKDAKDASEVVNNPLTTEDDARFDSLKGKAETKQTVAFVSYGVGAALAGVGVYFLVRKPRASQKTEAAAPRLTPVLAPERGGFGLGARLSF
ncbi:MAG: PEGA domain-containing protein [Myxococcota bacterium]